MLQLSTAMLQQSQCINIRQYSMWTWQTVITRVWDDQASSFTGCHLSLTSQPTTNLQENSSYTILSRLDSKTKNTSTMQHQRLSTVSRSSRRNRLQAVRAKYQLTRHTEWPTVRHAHKIKVIFCVMIEKICQYVDVLHYKAWQHK